MTGEQETDQQPSRRDGVLRCSRNAARGKMCVFDISRGCSRDRWQVEVLAISQPAEHLAPAAAQAGCIGPEHLRPGPMAQCGKCRPEPQPSGTSPWPSAPTAYKSWVMAKHSTTSSGGATHDRCTSTALEVAYGSIEHRIITAPAAWPAAAATARRRRRACFEAQGRGPARRYIAWSHSTALPGRLSPGRQPPCRLRASGRSSGGP
jgi:hypothetical protein